MSTPSAGAYVPPHLRNRSTPSSKKPIDSPPASSSAKSYSSAPSRGSTRSSWGPSDSAPQSPSQSSRAQYSSNSAPGPSRRGPPGSSGGYFTAPSLYVFGDSFVGPMKLLSEDCAKVTTFKGASAKGLNNPNSIKQVSRDLLPALNQLLAPPPYAYVPSSGRWALLIFGNVDLQINYLWQLANKPIASLSETSTQTRLDDESEDTLSNVLATATETSATGPALGPEAFVDTVIKAYTSWLQREVVDGPIGKHLTEAAQQRQTQASGSSGSVRRRAPPTKLLIAAALPPLIEDDQLPRIPEKYVERLEEDHEKAQRAMERASTDEGKSRTPWSRGSPREKDDKLGDAGIEVGLSMLAVSDAPASPMSSSSSSTSSSQSESQATLNSSIHTAITSPSSPTSRGSRKTPVTELLQHDPPLCTLPVRVRMTNAYNAALRAYCEQHPDIFAFVDIAPAMREGSEAKSLHGEVDRAVWACPVDSTNVHPLWEPTLPLWKKELGEIGLPVDKWTISEDAEETFRAYEVDKRRRTDQSGFGDRIKLRDE